jgi:hypothetical protein
LENVDAARSLATARALVTLRASPSRRIDPMVLLIIGIAMAATTPVIATTKSVSIRENPRPSPLAIVDLEGIRCFE